MRLLKIFLIAVIITTAYCVVACCWLLMYAGVTNLPSALYITLDSQLVVWTSFFQFLVDHSFCPWLMIFRGRSSTQIVLETSCHFYGIFDLTSGFNLTNVSSFFSCVVELSMGPAIGTGLLFLWAYISHKLYSIILSKLINHRK